MSGAARVASRIARSALCLLEAAGRSGVSGGRGGPAEGARLLSRIAARLASAHGLRIALTGELPGQPAVYVCNHVSYLDPIAISAVLPALPLAKAEVRRWPLIGGLSRSLGVRFVRRDSPHSGAMAIRWMVRALNAGASVLAFPEGTTTAGTSVLPFKPGAFAAARRAGVVIVPLAISYAACELAWTGDATFLPHYLRTASRASIDVRLVAGEPLRPTRYVTDLELAHRAAAIVTANLREDPWDSRTRSTISRAA